MPPTHRFDSTSLTRLGHLRWILAAVGLLALASCSGGGKIQFRYPGEEVDFTLLAIETPALYLDVIRDLRPAEQRAGEGKFMEINYPSDDSWQYAVVQVYRDALVQDLTQTNLVEMVPLRSQADYTLSVDILSLGNQLDRNPLSFLLPTAIGFGVGYALGSDSSDSVKKGALLGVVGLLAIPMPTPHRAEAEVRMTLYDAHGEMVWQRSCMGEVDDKALVTATSRRDQKLVDKFLTTAVKRCNACLLGQLRQALLAETG